MIKEGGKKGVEIEGAAEMGGLDFFCTTIESPEGDQSLLLTAMQAMNADPDPLAEERKGCSGFVGKMIFSAGTAQLAIVAYVPKPESNKSAEKVDVTEWIKSVAAGRPPCGHGTRACREGQAAQDGDQGGRQEGRRDRGRRRDGRPRLLMHDHRVARGRPVAAAHGDAGDERKSRPACRGAQGLLGLRGQDDLPSTATRRPR